MRHVPLPPDSAVRPEHVRPVAQHLRAVDVHKLLEPRNSVLARVLAFATRVHGDASNVLLIECGAHQHEVADTDPTWEYNSAISHFLALHGQELGLEYHAFDVDYTRDKLHRNIDQAVRERWPKGSALVEKPELAPQIEEAVARVSIGSYADLQALIGQTDKGVLLFSSQVLNDPGIEVDTPFWQLPGTHFHTGSLVEMCERLQISTRGLRGLLMPKTEDDEANLRYTKKLLIGKASNHRRAFVDWYGLPPATNVRWSSSKDGIYIRYRWSAE